MYSVAIGMAGSVEGDAGDVVQDSPGEEAARTAVLWVSVGAYLCWECGKTSPVIISLPPVPRRSCSVAS